MEKKDKIHTYYYVFFDYKNEKYFDGGVTRKNEWTDNIEYCFYVKDLSRARDVKKEIKKYYDIDCKILKVDLLEID